MSDYKLTLTFANGEVKVFDVKPYLNIGVFKELKDPSLFNSVKPFLGSVQWKHGQDLCPDTLYLESVVEHEITVLRDDAKETEKAEIELF